MIFELKFEGIDDWNRPVFKEIDSRIRYGDVNKLWTYEECGEKNEKVIDYYKNNIDALEYFGTSFNCEPHGGNPYKYKLTIL